MDKCDSRIETRYASTPTNIRRKNQKAKYVRTRPRIKSLGLANIDISERRWELLYDGRKDNAINEPIGEMYKCAAPIETPSAQRITNARRIKPTGEVYQTHPCEKFNYEDTYRYI